MARRARSTRSRHAACRGGARCGWRATSASRCTASGVALALLRYRTVGWNGDGTDKIEDARWALDQIREKHGAVPVAVLGHSMGGRTACRVADHDLVRGVVALAPWLPRGEPVTALTGRMLHAAHGSRDHITRAAETRAYVERARSVAREATYTEMARRGHYLLRGASDVERLRARRRTTRARGGLSARFRRVPPDSG